MRSPSRPRRSHIYPEIRLLIAVICALVPTLGSIGAGRLDLAQPSSGVDHHAFSNAAGNTHAASGGRARTADVTADPVLVGAGDITDCTSSGDEATAKLLDGITGTVITLGDNAYPNGSAAQYADCYGPTWGRHRARTRPAAGNHEYHTQDASAYYGYFGRAAGDPSKGYYSYDRGRWHIIVLNSNCRNVGGCDAGSPQERWLRADLAAHPTTCTLAYWHHPLFSSGEHGGSARIKPIWQALYDYGGDVVLAGHDHDYERFAPLDPSGNRDARFGIREFVVGTGGRSQRSFAAATANSEVRNSGTFGVLKLRLHATSYSWRFVPVAGKTFTDTGSAFCHAGRPPRLTFGATADAYVAAGSPSTNFGAAASLKVDAAPSRESYLRFAVSGVSGAVTAARLRVRAFDGSATGVVELYPTGGAWTETGITWNSRPPATGGAIDAQGEIGDNTWVEYDVTSVVTGNGAYNFKLDTGATDGVSVYSREGDVPPQLIVTVR